MNISSFKISFALNIILPAMEELILNILQNSSKLYFMIQ